MYAIPGRRLCYRRLRRPGSPGAQRIDFLIGGKPPGLLLREQQLTVDGDLKHAADPGYQLDIRTVKFFQPRPRTESPRFIVSRLAPLDPDLHPFLRSFVGQFAAPLRFPA